MGKLQIPHQGLYPWKNSGTKANTRAKTKIRRAFDAQSAARTCGRSNRRTREAASVRRASLGRAMEHAATRWRRVRQGMPPTVDSAQRSTHHAANDAEHEEEPLHGAGGGVACDAPPPRRDWYHPGAKEAVEKGKKNVVEALCCGVRHRTWRTGITKN